MPQIQSQVLNNIALDLGRNEQFSGADLQEIVVPTVGLERYRRRVTFFQAIVPVTIVQSKIKMTFAPRKDVSRNIILAELVNGDTGKLLINGGVTLTEFQTFIIEPLNVKMDKGPDVRDTVIGPQTVNGASSGANDNFRPLFLWVPRDSEFVLRIDSSGATFETATNIQVRMWFEDAPAEELLVGGAPSETIVA